MADSKLERLLAQKKTYEKDLKKGLDEAAKIMRSQVNSSQSLYTPSNIEAITAIINDARNELSSSIAPIISLENKLKKVMNCREIVKVIK